MAPPAVTRLSTRTQGIIAQRSGVGACSLVGELPHLTLWRSTRGKLVAVWDTGRVSIYNADPDPMPEPAA